MRAAGYQVRGEYGLPGRRYFTKDKNNLRTHNVHIFQQDDSEITRHLAFAAYLRAHPDVRDDYAALKEIVYSRHPDEIEAYNDGKNDWIQSVEKQALVWYCKNHK